MNKHAYCLTSLSLLFFHLRCYTPLYHPSLPLCAFLPLIHLKAFFLMAQSKDQIEFHLFEGVSCNLS